MTPTDRPGDRPISLSLTLANEPAVDPVCGMTVDPASAAGSATHAGTAYHFCSRHCLAKFTANPDRYLQPGIAPDQHACCGGAHAGHSAPAPAIPGATYTCPMHLEVVNDGPGTCPKCGMALEPMVPQAGPEDDTELRDMTRRFVVATALTLPVFAVAMLPMVPGVNLPHGLTANANWLGLLLATPVVFWAGGPFFVRAWQALRHRTANMFTLIALGTGAAWGYSAVATLAPDAFPPGFRDAHGVIPTYFESAAVIVTLVLLGQVLELRARRRTGTRTRGAGSVGSGGSDMANPRSAPARAGIVNAIVGNSRSEREDKRDSICRGSAGPPGLPIPSVRYGAPVRWVRSAPRCRRLRWQPRTGWVGRRGGSSGPGRWPSRRAPRSTPPGRSPRPCRPSRPLAPPPLARW